ncbi:hypothetical protein [Mycobacterium sp. KBS0706]|uniref:hypothetical protein n=1 Tax=Mycobacterium sp. KBS0706 TaxID=2578109 RepID=UPI00163D4EA6|nr:hypothetical protein [Mycobacterium sp. KBS0706]
MPSAMLLVGGMFTAGAILLFLLVRHLWWTEHRPSTALVMVIAFDWAVAAMVGSMILVSLTSGRGRRTARGRRAARARRGRVTVELQESDPRRTTRLTGPGAEMSASADIRVGSRLPALFLFAASAGLAAFVVWFHLQGQSTWIGTGVSLVLASYVGNWARNAWPRPEADS